MEPTPSALAGMAERTVLQLGDPLLRKLSLPVTRFATAELLALITDLRDTMAACDGAGLAAPQIGGEGCLSVPGSRGEVSSWQAIHYRGFDAQGQPIARSVEGVYSRVVQHDCDHLDGVLFPDRLENRRDFGLAGEPR